MLATPSSLRKSEDSNKPLTTLSNGAEMVKSYQATPKEDPTSPPSEICIAQPSSANGALKKPYNKKKMIAIISLFVCLVGVATFCAIYFTMDHSSIRTQLLREGTGELQGQKISYQEHHVKLTFKDNTESEMTLFTVTTKGGSTRRLSGENGTTQGTADLTCYYGNMKNANETIRLCDQAVPSNPNIFSYDSFMDGTDLLKQLSSSNETDSNRRFLQADGTTQDAAANLNQFIEDLKSEAGINLNFSLQSGPTELTNHESTSYGNRAPVITSKVTNLTDPNTSEPETKNDAQNPAARMLSWRKRLRRLVNKVVAVVKQSAPIIGAVVGAVVGGVTGGLVGAYEGAVLGYKIGSAAQTIANDCLPSNASGNVKFKCDVKKLTSDAAIAITASGINEKFQIQAKAEAYIGIKPTK